MKPESFLEQILFSTLKIELLDDEGGTKGIGKGFLVRTPLANKPEKGLMLLVSNKHVFEGGRGFIVNFHSRKSNVNEPDLGKIVKLSVKDFKNIYHPHSNQNVDLACLNVTEAFVRLKDQIFYRNLDINFFAQFTEPDLDVGQRVVFVGYPENRYDMANNLPIVRNGYIATHPKIDFNNEPQFVIDAQVFPGSSGSPVLLNVKEAEFSRGHINLSAGIPYLLLGVVAQTMIRNNKVNFLPAQIVPTTEEIIGLGLVFKSTTLAELVKEVSEYY